MDIMMGTKAVEHDPTRDCPECGGSMHYCGDDRIKRFGNFAQRGCGGRGKTTGHPLEGRWFVCVICDVKVKA